MFCITDVNCWLTHRLEYGAKWRYVVLLAEDCLIAARSMFAVLAVALAAAASAGERCSAIDGDTLQCGRERVRIEGLRAPGLQEPGGPEARQRLQRRIQSGELVIQRKGRDKYGRTLARAYVNGNRITQLDVTPKSGRANR
jgi:endonuclease YncB( thermonuclease family)